jgi:iron complex transport system permease protein
MNTQNITDIINKRKARYIILHILMMMILVIVFLIDLMHGAVNISFSEIFSIIFSNSSSDINRLILIDYRIPKAITALIAGAALSLSGLQMQSVFRNPLAGPYVLGISSGASLGIALLLLGFNFISFDIFSNTGIWSMAIASCIGAGIVLIIILIISFRIQDNVTILILGMLFSGIVSSVISVLQYYSNESMLKAYIIWTMGNLSSVTMSQIKIMAILVAIGILLSIISTKALNAQILGETYARSLGINIFYSRSIIFISTGIMTGAVTAFCGPIGFIGIAVPHIARLMYKTSDHKILIPSGIFIGSITMLISDILSQLPAQNIILPINSVTSIIGIPIVIYIIIKNKKFTMV